MLLLFVAGALAGHAQTTGNNPLHDPTQVNVGGPGKSITMDQQDLTQEMRQVRLLNTARQKAIVSDVDKLLALARLLNAGISAEGATLTAAQRMKMAADIEKLAHSVKERMTYAASGAPTPGNPFRSWQ
jgi:Spy/CpxP family protein refolding chaperone